MASAFALNPGSLAVWDPETRQLSPSAHQQHVEPSPDNRQFVCGDFGSPSHTPALSSSALSHYQPSDLDDFGSDPFFGADLADLPLDEPSFLGQQLVADRPILSQPAPTANSLTLRQETGDGPWYPLTPTHTASVHATTPQNEPRDPAPRPTPEPPILWVSPEQLQNPAEPVCAPVDLSDIIPSHDCSNRSSEDNLAPGPVVMDPPSPRVTVSAWDQGCEPGARPVERGFGDCYSTARSDFRSAGDLISSAHAPDFVTGFRASRSRWHADSAMQRCGLGPECRSAGETPSINEVMAERRAQERNQDVDKWLTERFNAAWAPNPGDIRSLGQFTSDHDDGIPLGDQTENRYLAGQTYYNEQGSGSMTQIDRSIIAADHKWADAPMLPHITRGVSDPCQPSSSQAAIEKFERMCRDNDSIISRSATWGTRRRSHPSVFELAVENVTSGGFLKKLTMSRANANGDKSSKSGSLLRDLRGLVRRPSVSSLRKRSRSRSHGGKDDEDLAQRGEQKVKSEGTPHLSPASATPSWARKSTPILNTALASMAQGFASMGSSRSRSGSTGAATPATSPKTSLGSSLGVKNTLRRPRSKSEIPATSATPADPTESHPNLVGMWKRSGGPPVATLGKSGDAQADDDDDDDDDELHDENDLRVNPNIIDDVFPTFAGFQQHIVALNPGLDKTHAYLVDRIAQHQTVRFKLLLGAKVKHLGLGVACPCGPLCVALGGSANALDQNGDARCMDPFPTKNGEDGASAEGLIVQESFPPDIPMPPTQRLPAEFECQLCFHRKRFLKPSDWTKHVQEDVQPFTCTWDKCRDPKFFKRKADWVRHENEGHRHLEWWTCDIDDCRHTCFRRDNFLQHLVREHKFVEPKVKTKAALKRAGGWDPTWHRVEKCHVETSVQPQAEPCRFCGRVFPTWKKLTVHLAKHMEQIALPVLRLVAAKAMDLDADGTVSSVQDHRTRCDTSPCSQTAPAGPGFPRVAGAAAQYRDLGHDAASVTAQNPFAYPVMVPDHGPEQTAYFESPSNGNGQGLQVGPSGGLVQGYEGGHELQGLAMAMNGFGNESRAYSNGHELEAFPQLNALGLHTVGDGPMVGGKGYDAMMGACGGTGGPGSLSAFAPLQHHRGGGGNGTQEAMWEEVSGLSGFPRRE